jgi:ADP-ribose pyrophosphatase YjhB (NUDIX family)
MALAPGLLASAARATVRAMSSSPGIADGVARSGPRLERVPTGDDRPRLVCPDCDYVAYVNPRIVVGAVATWGEGADERMLLAKRAIAPRKGFWTIPAGFLEVGETIEAGAVRETWEEAGARIAVDALLGVYNIPRIGQVYMVFRARLLSPDIAAGAESEAVRLAAWDEVPWDDLAFPAVRWSLTHHRELAGRSGFAPRTEPPAVHWER